ncbi:MAG: helix-turn-helix transcriptional regulator [Cellulosilyticum sp.]|nr:helix-turn-helix transcriptional regulator [Cellulosilyticum sp.]
MFEKIRRITGVKEEHSILKCIKLLCLENDISVAELEKELGFSNGLISKWSNSSPTGDKIVKVAVRFGVSADYLLGLVEDIGTNDVNELHSK